MRDLSLRLPADPLKRAINQARHCRGLSWDESGHKCEPFHCFKRDEDHLCP